MVVFQSLYTCVKMSVIRKLDDDELFLIFDSERDLKEK